MEHTRRLEISSFNLLLRKKANSYCAGSISNCYEIGEVLHQTNIS